MPIQDNNIVMHSTRGMFGKQVVFKKRKGETYVSAPPKRQKEFIPGLEQLERQERFTKSVAFASAAMKDPDTKKAYAAKAKRKQTAYNVAFNDAFNAPEVVSLIHSGYTGQVGQAIIVQARDNFKVQSVKVMIHNSTNELIEQGDAIANVDGLNWTYNITANNATLAGTKITAGAVDLPGNEGLLEVTV